MIFANGMHLVVPDSLILVVVNLDGLIFLRGDENFFLTVLIFEAQFV